MKYLSLGNWAYILEAFLFMDLLGTVINLKYNFRSHSTSVSVDVKTS